MNFNSKGAPSFSSIEQQSSWWKASISAQHPVEKGAAAARNVTSETGRAAFEYNGKITAGVITT